MATEQQHQLQQEQLQHEQQKQEEEAAAMLVAVTTCKYSNRVLLKTILERDDGGVGLIGNRVLIGGWVKSSKEEIKDPVPPPLPPQAVDKESKVEISCVEIIQSRIPFFRSIINVLGCGNYHVREKLEKPAPRPLPPTLPSIAFLQVSDGSCVAALQVYTLISYMEQ